MYFFKKLLVKTFDNEWLYESNTDLTINQILNNYRDCFVTVLDEDDLPKQFEINRLNYSTFIDVLDSTLDELITNTLFLDEIVGSDIYSLTNNGRGIYIDGSNRDLSIDTNGDNDLIIKELRNLKVLDNSVAIINGLLFPINKKNNNYVVNDGLATLQATENNSWGIFYLGELGDIVVSSDIIVTELTNGFIINCELVPDNTYLFLSLCGLHFRLEQLGNKLSEDTFYIDYSRVQWETILPIIVDRLDIRDLLLTKPHNGLVVNYSEIINKEVLKNIFEKHLFFVGVKGFDKRFLYLNKQPIRSTGLDNGTYVSTNIIRGLIKNHYNLPLNYVNTYFDVYNHIQVPIIGINRLNSLTVDLSSQEDTYIDDSISEIRTDWNPTKLTEFNYMRLTKD